MSEYQYYEFHAVDRPLDRPAQQALRSISSRARITATSFTNEYNWGNLRGDPCKFMEQWFDLHLYITNWRTRRLMIRVPQKFLRSADIDRFVGEIDWVQTWTSGDNLIIDMLRDEVEPDDDEWEGGAGLLAALAPLRSDVMSGDLRLFYLLWLTRVQDGFVDDDEVEPLPGIGEVTGALEAFADFFGIDPDLVQAAGELGGSGGKTTSEDDLREVLAAFDEHEKTELLRRVAVGDVHVAAELRIKVAKRRSEPAEQPRTVAALRKRVKELEELRERAREKRREAEKRHLAAVAEKVRRARIDALKRRGASIWSDVEQEIERRNPSGYEKAIGLLADLRSLAAEEGDQDDFNRRFEDIRVRHEKKGRFIERLAALEGDGEAIVCSRRLL